MHPAVDAMIAHWQSQPSSHPENVGYASDPEADKLIRNNLVAFLMASAIDRTGNSRMLWSIPYYLKQKWGHLDTAKIAAMDELGLAAEPVIVSAPGQVSRRHLARTIISLAQVIENEHGGRPEGLLEGNIPEVMDNLQQVFGVGPNIARMIIIIRMCYFGLLPEKGGRLLPKIDVHVGRVLTRTGVVDTCTEQKLRTALRGYSDQDVAIIDQVCWQLGQNYCRTSDPKCSACPIGTVCEHPSGNGQKIEKLKSTEEA